MIIAESGNHPVKSFLVNKILLKNTYNLKLFFSKEIKVIDLVKILAQAQALGYLWKGTFYC
jgi:hypothetical protein